MNEPECADRSRAGKWTLWFGVALMVYVLSFGPTVVRIHYSHDWNNRSYVMHRRVYGPVWWCLLRSETCFNVLSNYCEYWAKWMGYPKISWSWHMLRAQEGLRDRNTA